MERCSHHWCTRLWSVTITFFPSVHVCPSCDACWPMLGDRSFWVVLISTLFTPFLKRQQHFLGFSDPAPTSAPSKNSRSGISWMRWKHFYFGQHHFNFFSWTFFFSCFFFPHLTIFFFFPAFFSLLHFFFLGTFYFLSCFFWPHPWPEVFFGNFLPPPPTYLLPFLSPTDLPPSWYPPPSPLTSIVKAWEPGRTSVALSFD